MKKYYRLTRENLAKVFTNPVFYIAILGVVFVYLNGDICRDENGTSYSLITIIMNADRTELLEKLCIDYQYTIYREPDSYLWMFAGSLATLPTVMLMCSANKNNNARFELYRTDRWSYTLAKLSSIMISGGAILTAGYGIYCILLRMVVGAEYEGTRMEMIMGEEVVADLMHSSGFVGVLLLKLLSILIFGMYATIIAFVCSAFMNNKYLILCIPFIFNYIVSKTIESIQLFEDARLLVPTSMKYIVFYERDRNKLIVIFIGISLVAVLFYRYVLGKKVDCSE